MEIMLLDLDQLTNQVPPHVVSLLRRGDWMWGGGGGGGDRFAATNWIVKGRFQKGGSKLITRVKVDC